MRSCLPVEGASCEFRCARRPAGFRESAPATVWARSHEARAAPLNAAVGCGREQRPALGGLEALCFKRNLDDRPIRHRPFGKPAVGFNVVGARDLPGGLRAGDDRLAHHQRDPARRFGQAADARLRKLPVRGVSGRTPRITDRQRSGERADNRTSLIDLLSDMAFARFEFDRIWPPRSTALAHRTLIRAEREAAISASRRSEPAGLDLARAPISMSIRGVAPYFQRRSSRRPSARGRTRTTYCGCGFGKAIVTWPLMGPRLRIYALLPKGWLGEHATRKSKLSYMHSAADVMGVGSARCVAAGVGHLDAPGR